jgi:hypothetical protein
VKDVGQKVVHILVQQVGLEVMQNVVLRQKVTALTQRAERH